MMISCSLNNEMTFHFKPAKFFLRRVELKEIKYFNDWFIKKFLGAMGYLIPITWSTISSVRDMVALTMSRSLKLNLKEILML